MASSEEEYDIVPKRSNKSLDRLRAIEEESDAIDSLSYNSMNFLPSLSLKPKKKKKKEKDKIPSFSSKSSNYDPDEWFNELIAGDKIKIKGKKRKGNIFEFSDDGDKKKKKGKDKDLVDYKKEFAPEAALYSGLLKEQQRFTDSLQKEYDTIKSSKSTARGYSKTLTDLTQNITTARSLAMQLIDKQVSIKKTAADLEMKQRKDATLNGLDETNMAEFGSTFLRQMINQKQNSENGNDENGIIDYTNDDEIFDIINDNLDGDESLSDIPSEVDAFLKYENSNVVVSVLIHNNDEKDFEFIAKDDKGNVLDDYPLPTNSYISVNRSSNIATDNYGQKYNIIWD